MDLIRQLALFLGAYFLYSIVRLVVHGGAYDPGYRPFGDAMRIIDVERVLHVFVEPTIQEWALSKHWLMVGADWIYLNAHLFVTIGVLAFIYVRHNRSFYFLRNTFIIAMVIALVGYWLYPTAPPRLMPEWGFTDAIKQFTGITVERGPSSEVLNLYAAVPSMHVCFAIMLGWPMVKFVAQAHRQGPVGALPSAHHLRRDRHRQPLPHGRLPRRADSRDLGAARPARAAALRARQVDPRRGAGVSRRHGRNALAAGAPPDTAPAPQAAAGEPAPPPRS